MAIERRRSPPYFAGLPGLGGRDWKRAGNGAGFLYDELGEIEASSPS